MNLTLIPSPYGLDQLRQGMGLAPEVLLAHGLREGLEADGHAVALVERQVKLDGSTVLDRIGQHLAELAEKVAEAARRGSLPVILGGDCLVAIGAAAGLRRALTEDFGIAWFDAHGDFNTPDTTLSGYLGGMPLACACGRGLESLRTAAGLEWPVAEANVSMVGVRDLDPPEKALIDSTPIRLYPPEAAAQFQPAALPTYLHFDIDALDPSLAPGVNYPVPHGLILEAAVDAARRARPYLAALSLTAVDPTHDRGDRTIHSTISLVRGILR